MPVKKDNEQQAPLETRDEESTRFKDALLKLLDEDKDVFEALKNFFLKRFVQDKDVRAAVTSIAASSGTAKDAKLLKDKDEEIAALNTRIAKLETDCKQLTTDKNRIQKENDALQGHLATAQKELSSVTLDKDRVQKENDALQGRIATMQKELSSVMTDKDRVQKENNTLEGRLVAAQKELSSMRADKDRALAEKTELYQKYGALDELEQNYRVYNALPQNIKTAMAGFICGDSLLSFAASGMRDSRLETFWEFCRTEVQKSSGLKYADEIAALFTFFFTSIHSVTESPLYELNVPQVGKHFDDGAMIVSNSSPAKDGVVEKTVLPGYSGKNSQKTVKKAVVTLR